MMCVNGIICISGRYGSIKISTYIKNWHSHLGIQIETHAVFQQLSFKYNSSLFATAHMRGLGRSESSTYVL